MPSANISVSQSQGWVLLTSENVTGSIRIQNWGSEIVLVQATDGATPPTDDDGGLRIPPGATPVGELDEWFPGRTANRLYGRSLFRHTTLSVVW